MRLNKWFLLKSEPEIDWKAGGTCFNSVWPAMNWPDFHVERANILCFKEFTWCLPLAVQRLQDVDIPCCIDMSILNSQMIWLLYEENRLTQFLRDFLEGNPLLDVNMFLIHFICDVLRVWAILNLWLENITLTNSQKFEVSNLMDGCIWKGLKWEVFWMQYGKSWSTKNRSNAVKKIVFTRQIYIEIIQKNF